MVKEHGNVCLYLEVDKELWKHEEEAECVDTYRETGRTGVRET